MSTSRPKPLHAKSRGALRVRSRTLPWGERTYIMGIINATPDSFSGDGVADVDAAIAYAGQQLERSADLLDIGAESTRPGHTPIDEETEAQRLLPVIAGVRKFYPQAIISADTFKADIYRRAHTAGADVLNSIWGLDDALLEVALQTQSPVIIMHNKAVAVYEGDVVDEVLRFLYEGAQRAVARGMDPSQIILDPGIGFGKDAEQNLIVLQALDRLVSLGFPTLLGTSRKSTIGKLTGKEPNERTYGTAATIALAIAAGIDIVRVHDVAQMRDVVSVSDAIQRGWRPKDWT